MFHIIKTGVEDAALFSEIIMRAYKNMEHKEWFALEDEDYIRNGLMEGRGLGYKAVESDTGTPAGVFLVVFPEEQDNLGRDCGMDPDSLSYVAHMDIAAVLPEFTGWGLQRKMMLYAEEEIRRKGYRHLMCTVHPDNRFSRNNVIKAGYRPVKTAYKYGGMLREIFLKNI